MFEMLIENGDGTQTFIKESGDPKHEAVLLLHGIGADHRMWAPQIETFTENGYFVLVPDLLGHGKSSKVKHLELSSWENQINGVLKAKKLSKCILVGVSMGGVIAQYYAMKHSSRIRKLVLSDTFGELKTLREKILGFAQVLGFRIFKTLGGKMLAKGMKSTYKAPFAELAKAYFSKACLSLDFDQMVLSRKAINKIDAIGKIDGEKMPTLVLVGNQFGKSFIELNRKIAYGIKGSQFVILENAMDPSNLVNSKEFNHYVLQFLKILP